jgi:hypothetical protein
MPLGGWQLPLRFCIRLPAILLSLRKGLMLQMPWSPVASTPSSFRYLRLYPLRRGRRKAIAAAHLVARVFSLNLGVSSTTTSPAFTSTLRTVHLPSTLLQPQTSNRCPDASHTCSSRRARAFARRSAMCPAVVHWTSRTDHSGKSTGYPWNKSMNLHILLMHPSCLQF